MTSAPCTSFLGARLFKSLIARAGQVAQCLLKKRSYKYGSRQIHEPFLRLCQTRPPSENTSLLPSTPKSRHGVTGDGGCGIPALRRCSRTLGTASLQPEPGQARTEKLSRKVPRSSGYPSILERFSPRRRAAGRSLARGVVLTTRKRSSSPRGVSAVGVTPSEALEVLGGDGERQLALVAINQNGPIELHAAPHQLKIRLAT